MDIKQTSPLLALAPELRNTIYRLALTTNGKVDIVTKTACLHRTSLLQTCTSIREEATGIFYAENDFHLSIDGNHRHIVKWLEMLSVKSGSARLVRSLTLDVNVSDTGYWAIDREARRRLPASRRHMGPFHTIKGVAHAVSDAHALEDAMDRALVAGLSVHRVKLAMPRKRRYYIQLWPWDYETTMYGRLVAWRIERRAIG